jgi:ribosomal-protein-alanine N-acetyltransferase
MTIRPARAVDLPRIIEITRACPQAAQWQPADYAACLLAPETMNWNGAGAALLLATAQGAVAGLILVRSTADELEILNLAVAPEARRTGTASCLLQTVWEAGQGAGARAAFCEVRESNAPALALYRRHGFTLRGRRVLYYSDPVEDALVLARLTAAD